MAVKHKTAKLLKDGAIFAFGLSEKTHGADFYSSEMFLTDLGEGRYVADGGKYYIGNGNDAALVSTFAKDSETDEYVFFVVDSQHENYEYVQNVVACQGYVAEYALNSYPITEEDILTKGTDAWIPVTTPSTWGNSTRPTVSSSLKNRGLIRSKTIP